MSNNMEVSVLLETPYMEQWAIDVIQKARKETRAEVTKIIVNKQHNQSRDKHSFHQYIDRLKTYGIWAFVLGWHRLFTQPSYLQKQPLDSLPFISEADVTFSEPIPSDGLGSRLEEGAVDRLATTDIAFRRGFGVLQGNALTAPKYGILSFHHGDIREYRGRPAAVWEYLQNASTAGVTLQRITEELDGGEIIVEKSIDIQEVNTWEEIKFQQFQASEDMLATAIKRLSSPGFEPKQPEDLGPIYSDPEFADTMKLFAKNSLGKLRNCVSESR
jgi:methionyl-tRNA formyltransferase